MEHFLNKHTFFKEIMLIDQEAIVRRSAVDTLSKLVDQVIIDRFINRLA